MKDVLTNLILVDILQYICVSNHHIVYFNLHNVVCQLYHNKAGKINKTIEIKQSILSDHNRITLEIDNQNVAGKAQYARRLNNILLNNRWVKEEASRENF